ncbi:MAG: PAS domain-containing sensor histidine kinase [Candidatus Solibacter usitatus]|nr:PAS domain-containing sensor histidine kinase [Candidatus Solibacter usitatus]
MYVKMYGRTRDTNDCDGRFRGAQGESAHASSPCVYGTADQPLALLIHYPDNLGAGGREFESRRPDQILLGSWVMWGQRTLRLLLSLAGVALVTLTGYALVPANPTTIGFAYLLLVLIVASLWGFFEAALASIAATLTFNFFFLPPVERFTIADPQNWVALFSFLTTALIASRLSAEATRRALDAVARQRDLERLYTLSRALLLIDNTQPFPKQLVRKLAEIFEMNAAVLYHRRSEEFYRAGPGDFDARRNRVITAERLGSEPIAGLALQGAPMPDAFLQGIANLVAIGLERSRGQDLASQVEAARHSEKLRMALLDAMAHECQSATAG